jgi:myo-inositol catabolism protein IolS
MKLPLRPVGLGCWAIGGPYYTEGEPTGWSGPLDEDDVRRALAIAADSGVNHFDTADVYGYGRSERLLGAALGNRSDIYVASKVGWAATTDVHVYATKNIRRQCETTLSNLKRDRIDIYYLHQCDFGVDDEWFDDACSTLLELKAEGKVGELGLSGYSSDELVKFGRQLRPAFVQSWADIEHTEFVEPGSDVSNLIKEIGASFVAMMPFGQGRLLGKYSSSSAPEFGDGDNRAGSSAFEAESLADLEPRLERLAERFGRTRSDLIRVSLGFLLSYEVVGAVVPGFRSLEQVSELLGAGVVPLSTDDREFVLSVFPRDEMPEHPWAGD